MSRVASLWAGCLLTAALLPAQADAEAPLRIEREIFVRGGASVCLAWSADGKWIASGGECGEVLVLEVATGAVRHELEAAHEGVGRLAFSPDGQSLAAVGSELSVWDVASGRPRGRLPCRSRDALAWSPDGLHLAFTPNDDDKTAVLTTSDLNVVATYTSTAPRYLAWSPDGRRLEVADERGRFHWYDIANPVDPGMARMTGTLVATAWLADGRALRLIREGVLGGLRPDPCFTVYAPRGMAADAAGQLVVVWNDTDVVGLDANGECFAFAGGGPVAVGRDGAWLRASAGELHFHRLGERQRSVPLPHRASLDGGVLTADGRHCAIARDGRPPLIFDLQTGTEVTLPDGVGGTPLPNRASPELLLLSPPADGQGGLHTVRWWSIAAVVAGRTEPVRELTLSGVPKWSAAHTSHDGRSLALGEAVFDLMVGGDPQWTVATNGSATLRIRDGRRQALVVMPRRAAAPGGYLELVDADRADVERIVHHAGALWADFSPDGSRVALLTQTALQILATSTLEPLATLKGSWSGPGVWLDDGRVLVSGANPCQVELRAGIRRIRTVPVRGAVRSLAIDRNGRRAIAVLNDRIVVLRIDG